MSKNMKINKIIALAITAGFLLSTMSCVHDGDLNLDPVPDIAFTYTSDGLTLTFTSDPADISDVTWSTSDGGSGSGTTFSHEFPSPSTYWVEMTGTYNGKQQSVSTKVLVAKPAIVSMTDNTLSDWDNVKYEDFIFTGQEEGSVIKVGKVDYDSNWLYFYVALNASVITSSNATDLIWDFFIDVDGDSSTGFSYHDVGGEYLIEGKLFDDDAWYDVYPGVTGADWWGDPITDPKYVNAIVIGAQEKTDDVYRIEFAINRRVYGITGTIAGFGLCQFDNDWSDLDYMTYEGSTAILLSLDKTE